MGKLSLRWPRILGTLALIGGLTGFVLLATARHQEVANAASDEATPGARETVVAVAKRTEQLHVAHTQLAATEEDENDRGATAPPTLISPEEAVAAVQAADPANRAAGAWVGLQNDANGQPVYAVRIGGIDGRPLFVDARTGRVLSSGSR